MEDLTNHRTVKIGRLALARGWELAQDNMVQGSNMAGNTCLVLGNYHSRRFLPVSHNLSVDQVDTFHRRHTWGVGRAMPPLC